MGAVSARGVRRDRRLAKRNSPLYGPAPARIPAVARFPPHMTEDFRVAPGMPRAGPHCRGPVPDYAMGVKGTVFCCVVDLPRNAAARVTRQLSAPKGGAAARQVLLQKAPVR